MLNPSNLFPKACFSMVLLWAMSSAVAASNVHSLDHKKQQRPHRLLIHCDDGSIVKLRWPIAFASQEEQEETLEKLRNGLLTPEILDGHYKERLREREAYRKNTLEQKKREDRILQKLKKQQTELQQQKVKQKWSKGSTSLDESGLKCQIEARLSVLSKEVDEEMRLLPPIEPGGIAGLRQEIEEAEKEFDKMKTENKEELRKIQKESEERLAKIENDAEKEFDKMKTENKEKLRKIQKESEKRLAKIENDAEKEFDKMKAESEERLRKEEERKAREEKLRKEALRKERLRKAREEELRKIRAKNKEFRKRCEQLGQRIEASQKASKEFYKRLEIEKKERRENQALTCKIVVGVLSVIGCVCAWKNLKG